MIDETEYVFTEEIEDLEATKEQRAERSAELDPTSNEAQQINALGSQLDTQLAGLIHHSEDNGGNWNADSITLGTLSYGERERAYELIEEAGTPERGQSLFLIAAATCEAPYLSHEPGVEYGKDAFSETVDALKANTHPGFVDWAEIQVNESFRKGVELGNRYMILAREKRIERMSQTANGSDT